MYESLNYMKNMSNSNILNNTQVRHCKFKSKTKHSKLEIIHYFNFKILI